MASVTGFVLAGNNQVGPILIEKFDWSHKDGNKWNTMISTCAILGLVMGSLFSGFFLPMGRRICAIYALAVGAIALVPTILWLNFYVICVFRLIFGFSCGVIVSCSNLLSNETVPKEH